MYEDSLEYIRIADLSPQNLAILVNKHKDIKESMHLIGIPFLYNSSGELVARIARIENIHAYIGKGHNLEGVRRLAWLKISSKVAVVPLDQMQQFLDVRANDLGNPYTSGPMKWDLKKSRIFFNDIFDDKPVEIYL